MLFKSIILEKEHDITQDPRGVVLTGDALRSLWTLGLGKHVSSIGQGRCYIQVFSHLRIRANVSYLVELHSLNFHTTTHQNEPFYRTMLDSDVLEHALPSTILQSQPRLGKIPYIPNLTSRSTSNQV
jgi:2-polyprenyl-6-methoxyphenol hydroxylase-like FAD-dependent oxidoreductase